MEPFELEACTYSSFNIAMIIPRDYFKQILSTQKLAPLETPIARYNPGQKEKSGNSCCFQHIDHLFLGHHHHITGTPSQNDQDTIKT